MRFLSFLRATESAEDLRAIVGESAIRVLRPTDAIEVIALERYAATVLDARDLGVSGTDRIPDVVGLIRRVAPSAPVVLRLGMNRPDLDIFRSLALEELDVRPWLTGRDGFADNFRLAAGPRASTPASRICRRATDAGGLGATVVTAAAILGDRRRSVDEIACGCGASREAIREAAQEYGLRSVASLVAHVRCLHALWAQARGAAERSFWAAGGFRTLAELSEFMTRHTGAPLSHWRGPGGFERLLDALLAPDGTDAASAPHGARRGADAPA